MINRLPQRARTAMATALVLWVTCLAATGAETGARFNVCDYGAKADGATDDAPAIAKAVEAAMKAGKGATVFIPAGRYSLKTPRGGGMITLAKADGLTLEGEAGTMLISSEPGKHMVLIDHSANITIRRLELDRNPLVFTQGRIEALDMAAKTVQVTIDKGYDEPDARYLARLQSFLVFTDPRADTWDHSRWWPTILKRERLEPMKWRFTLSLAPLDTYAGKRFLIWDNTYKGWGVVCTNSRDVLVEDVSYYGGGADAGLQMWSCPGDVTVRRLKVGIPPGSDRLLAAAGGSQEFQNRGTLTLEGCDFSRIDDDGVNMGTTYAKVLKQINPRTIIVQENGIPFQAGDTITLWDWFKKNVRHEAKLVACAREDDRCVRLALDSDVQVLHPVGSPGLPQRSQWHGRGRFEEYDGIDRIADQQAAGKLTVRNCRFQTMRARNILVKGSDALIENCTFYNTHMTAILAGPEFYWGEAPAVRNLTIRNNRFINIDGPSINLGCHKSEESYDNRNILIEGNTFENYGARGGVGIAGKQGTAVLIRNADGVVFRHNTFGSPSPTAPADARPLLIEVSRNVTTDPPFSWQNPVDFAYPHFDGTRERSITELRDPAIIREGDRYYLTFTVFPFSHSDARNPAKIDHNSPPGIMLYSSADLKSWRFENWLLKSSDLPEDCPYKHRFWAPEIHKINGRFYLIFTADNWIKDQYNKGGKIGAYLAFVGAADKITGPYQHITWLKGAGCDSTLFADDDGKAYAIMPFGNEYLQEVDLRGIDRGDIRLVGQRKMIVARDNRDVGKQTSPDYMEGPWMIKRHGKYVLFTAAPYRASKAGQQPATPPDLAQGYWVGAAVADNIQGPYRKQPQVFLGGHIAVFTGPDGKEWFSYRGESGGQAQGRLCIDPIPFHDDGSVKPFGPSIGPAMPK